MPLHSVKGFKFQQLRQVKYVNRIHHPEQREELTMRSESHPGIASNVFAVLISIASRAGKDRLESSASSDRRHGHPLADTSSTWCGIFGALLRNEDRDSRGFISPSISCRRNFISGPLRLVACTSKTISVAPNFLKEILQAMKFNAARKGAATHNPPFNDKLLRRRPSCQRGNCPQITEFILIGNR